MSIFVNRDKILQRISYLLIIGLILNQVYEFLHLHHIHEAGSIVVETSYHPLNTAIKHSSDHNHAEEEKTQKDPHKFKNHIDWSLRSSRSNFIKIDPLIFLFTITVLPNLLIEKSIVQEQLTFQIKNHYFSLLIIRGPPIFT